MALLNKLFANRKKSCKLLCKSTESLELPRLDIPFSKDQIRVLVFRECEWRGRKLLFDLKSIKKTEPGCQPSAQCRKSTLVNANDVSTSPNKNECFTEVAQNGTVYQYLRPRSDVKMLGEMIFGSVAMSYKGVTVKIHNIRSPPQLMFSKVFPAPNPTAYCDKHLDTARSLQNSCSESIPHPIAQHKSACSIAHSVPVDVPVHLSLNVEDDLELLAPSSLRSNSSFSSIRSFQHSPEGSNNSLNSLTRSGSLNSLNRRWLRTLTTSMEFGLQRMTEENKEDTPIQSTRRNKLGVSVVILLNEKEEYERDYQSFFFSHITLIERHINKLSMVVEKAYVQRKQFVHLVMQGVEDLQQALWDLYMAPRFPDPVWLSMMSPVSNRHLICHKFMNEFMSLIENYDNKTTNFFMSTLLTAILTHHLAWVPTVTPSGILASHSFHEKHSAKWLDLLARRHPYNPLWVQLGDLYGALGIPCKMAKTIVIGNDSDLVRNIIYCLTYFIRCSEVYERTESRMHPSSRHRILSVSSNSSGSTLMGDPTQYLQPDIGTTSRGLDGISDSESEVAERTKERIQGMTRSSGRKSISGLCDLVKFEMPAGAERQEGEGDEEDVVLEEQTQKVQLRTGRHLTETRENLCACKKSDRHGVIFDCISDVSDVASSPLKNSMHVVEREYSRDSGIESFVEMEGTKMVTSSAQVKNNVAMPARLKRKTLHGKVSFTIGNIPLEDICSPTRKERESSPVIDYLVCTCGKHVPGGIKENGTLDSKVIKNALERTTNPPKVSLSAVNAKLLGMRNCENEISTSELSGHFSDLGLSKNSSLACDSGIHSCEDSRTDLVNCRTSNTSSNTGIEALQIKLPQVKREHVRNVGRSRVFTSSTVNEDFITDINGSKQSKICDDEDLQNNVVNQNITSANCKVFTQNGINVGQKMDFSPVQYENLQENDYGRSNSMFDEYFDENIELKMLDDESFQERLKQRKSKTVSKLKKTQDTTRNVTTPSSCNCNDLKCFSRDSLLDGQEEAHYCDIHSSHHSIISLSRSQSMNNDDHNDSKFIENAVEIELPKSETKQPTSQIVNECCRGFGWSLLANYVDHYMSDFTLQGTKDVKFGEKLMSDLRMTVQMSVLDEPIAEAVCIIANTNNWTVELVSSRHAANVVDSLPIGVRVTPSQLIVGMTETLLHLWKLKMSPEFCLMHLEDRLQEFYFKSRLLAEHFLDNHSSDVQKVACDLGLDPSDLPLLFAVSSIHS